MNIPTTLQDTVAVEVITATDRFLSGDLLIGERLPASDKALAVSRDCIAWLPNGSGLLCHVDAGSDSEHFTLTPLSRGAKVYQNAIVEWLAPLHQLQRVL